MHLMILRCFLQLPVLSEAPFSADMVYDFFCLIRVTWVHYGKRLWTHLELLLSVIHLQVQAVGSIPVPIDNVSLAIAVKIGQSNPSAMLHGVLQTYRNMVILSVIQRSCPWVSFLPHSADIQGHDVLRCASHQPAAPHQWRFRLRCSWTGSLVRIRCRKTHRTGFDWQWARPRHLALLHKQRELEKKGKRDLARNLIEQKEAEEVKQREEERERDQLHDIRDLREIITVFPGHFLNARQVFLLTQSVTLMA